MEKEVKQEQTPTQDANQTVVAPITDDTLRTESEVKGVTQAVNLPTADNAVDEYGADSPAYARAQIAVTQAKIDQAKADQAATEAKVQKEQKKQQWIHGIGNIISNIANLCSTTQGAPSQKLINISEKLKADFEKAQAARQKNYDSFLAGLGKELNADKDALKTAWRFQWKKARAEASDANKEADRKIRQQEQDRKNKELDARLPKLKAEADLATEKANTEKAKQGTEHSKQGLNRAKASKAHSGGGSSSGGQSYIIYDHNGNVAATAKTPKEAIVKAREHGYSLTTERDIYGNAPSSDDIMSQIGAESSKRKSNKKR